MYHHAARAFSCIILYGDMCSMYCIRLPGRSRPEEVAVRQRSVVVARRRHRLLRDEARPPLPAELRGARGRRHPGHCRIDTRGPHLSSAYGPPGVISRFGFSICALDCAFVRVRFSDFELFDRDHGLAVSIFSHCFRKSFTSPSCHDVRLGTVIERRELSSAH